MQRIQRHYKEMGVTPMARKRVVSRNVRNVRATAVIYNLEDNTFSEKEVYYPIAISENEKKVEDFLVATLCLTPKQKLLELLDKEVIDCYMSMPEESYYRLAKTVEKC